MAQTRVRVRTNQLFVQERARKKNIVQTKIFFVQTQFFSSKHIFFRPNIHVFRPCVAQPKLFTFAIGVASDPGLFLRCFGGSLPKPKLYISNKDLIGNLRSNREGTQRAFKC